MLSVIEVRNRCRREAARFHYSLILFDRFPMWIFRYFQASDPLCVDNIPNFKKLHILFVYMIINKIDAGLMMAFYNAADQDMDTIFRLHKLFSTMWKLYNEAESIDYIPIFGTYFTFHCESRTLRRIDMSVVNYNRGQRNAEHFIPNSMRWKQERIVRSLIRRGEFTVRDEEDLREVKEAWQDGLRRQGRMPVDRIARN